MAVRIQNKAKRARGHGRVLAAWAWLGLILPSASCVPAGFAEIAATASAPQSRSERLRPIDMADRSPDQSLPGWAGLFNPAIAANAAIPVFSGPNPAAGAYAFTAGTPLDRMRSLDCLAQAIYYEARSESEDGQRAVAQVVLNRVRHPAWPNSVCGVVYQGPMRAGGGCQFTFTCDGSLARRAGGPAWARARRLAAEALAGRSLTRRSACRPIYHTNAVFPAWAPRLVKTAMIGAHNFYRLPGLAGAPGAFADAYAGSEPLPRPSFYMAGRRGGAGGMPGDVPAYAPPPTAAAYRAAGPVPSDIPQDPRWAASNLPESTVREEYRQSGQWRDDAPAAVTGR